MKKSVIILGTLSIISAYLVLYAHAIEDLPNLILKTRSAVVTIVTYGETNKLLKQGSGFFITKDGHLITNRHVVEGAWGGTITTSEGKEHKVNKIVAVDSIADLARLRIESETPFIPLTLSQRIPKVGEKIVVIGSPLGLEQTVSEGIISAIREFPGVGLGYQLTAPVSPGSSGSPVITMGGEVIGVATLQVIHGQNLNFAIPSTRVLALQPVEERLLIEWTTGLSPTQLREVRDLKIEGFKEAAVGNWKEAINYLEKAVKIHPKSGTAWRAIGDCSRRLNQLEKAIDAYQKAIAFGEEDARTYRELGRVYINTGRYEEAATSLTQAIRLEPSDANCHMLLGIAYDKMGLFKEAIDALVRSIALAPNVHWAYGVLHGIYFKQKQYDLAERYIRKAIELKPDEFHLREALIRQYIIQRKNAAAYEEYKILKELSPETAKKLERDFRFLGYEK
jgi:Flp pilus assembly protein TadD